MKVHKLITSVFLFFSFHIFFASFSNAQGQIVKGKVIDGETAEGVSFANVYPKKNPQGGTTTDFDGYFTLNNILPEDSIVVSYIGYKTKIKTLTEGKQESGFILLNFQLESEEKKLEDITFVAGEDPSYPIMRKVLENKEKNDRRKLDEYEFESYVKIELDVDNISDKFNNRKLIKKITTAIDSAGGLTGEDGKKLIPLFFSETVSRFFYNKNPQRKKEVILKTKVQGVGISPDNPISQILGQSFQEYNFYKNWMNIFQKDFVSPLSDGWKANYDYYLEDSVMIGPHWCYKIEVVPKRAQDLAFEGYIWIDSKSFALKQIDVGIGKKANINFIERIRLQQELAPTENGPWIAVKTRVLMDVRELTKNSAGLLAKFYISTKDIVLNKKYPLKFFDEKVIVDVNSTNFDNTYWQKARHDTLNAEEIKTYSLIDSIRNIPTIKFYSEIINILSTNYYTIGPIDFGNYLYTIANNDIEGFRARLGIRTNDKFSRFVEFKGFLAYGFGDKWTKYNSRLRFIPTRRPWTELAVGRTEDIAQFAVNPDGINIPEAFLASLTWGFLSRRSPFYKVENYGYFQTDLFKGVTASFRFRNAEFRQIGNHFAYVPEPENAESPILRDFETSEMSFEIRFAKKERFYYFGNYRISLGTEKLPIVKLRYTIGLKGTFGSDFEYHKFALSLEQDVKLGVFGNAYYNITAGYIPSRLPYPLLEIHLGNRINIYNFYGFNLMNFLEFASDRHIMLNFEHNMEGMITNRIPLMKRLKLRSFWATNILFGSLNEQNRSLIPSTDTFGNALIQPSSLGSKPYLEIGYGIYNIFKFFRITFLHRLTYLDNPGIRKFGVFFSARFNL